jgi:hypothetical protein
VAEHLDDIKDAFSDARRESQRGIAAAVAMGTAFMPSAPGKISYTLNGARHRGENAFGGSAMYRLNTSNAFAVSGGVSYGGKKNATVRLGVAGEF